MKEDKEKARIAFIMSRFKASEEHKGALGVDDSWALCEKYWAGEVNLPEDEDDPGSETNIIQPIIESQVADLVDGKLDILVQAGGPSDMPFARQVQQILSYIWHRNKMVPKLDEAERDRLNLGNSIWKVYWDGDAMKGRGLPMMDPCGPDTVYFDPKVTHPRKIQEGDFMFHVRPQSLSQLRRRFGDKAKAVLPDTTSRKSIFGSDDNSNAVINDQALLYEYWEKDDEGNLNLVYLTKDVILEDSSEEEEHASFYEHGKFPFVLIVGYLKKGRVWGMGDTEQLIVVQDLINDLDDQIIMNARLTGNNQTVVNKSSGINIKKWTNSAGLKIPAVDHNGFRQIDPRPIPAYITLRRDKAFQESEVISGRSDVLEGRRSGSLRAASAIIAMQEAGSRRGNHKKLMLQEGFTEVLELVLDYVKEFMTTEQAFDITEDGKTDYLWFRGSDLKEIPWKTMNENFDPTVSEPGTDVYKDLYEPDPETGEAKPVMKEAEFDLRVSLGAGMPNSKSFIYQAVIELARENLITIEEGRETLKHILNWPIIEPFAPKGTFAGRNSSAEQLAVANGGVPGQDPNAQPAPAAQPTPEVDPSQQETMALIQQTLAQLDPEMAMQVLQILQQGGMTQ